MAQQTAIEWLVEEINKHKAWADPSQLEPLIEQAKQMEKEQIKDSYWNGTVDMEKSDALIEAEYFYNETYNK